MAWGNRPEYPEYYEAVSPRVTAAFKKLRKAGLTCLRSYKCCMGCACAALDPKLRANGNRGAVYFHKQDASAFRKGKNLHLRFGLNPEKDGDEHHDEWVKLGYEIVAAFQAEGLVVDWKGDPDFAVELRTAESYAMLQAAKRGVA